MRPTEEPNQNPKAPVTAQPPTTLGREAWSLRTQQRAPADPLTPNPFQPEPRRPRRTEVESCAPDCTVNVPPMSYRRERSSRSGAWTHRPPKDTTSQMLLRKEVIQPHLPVRLPCYDLVLITDPTFDGSFHKG